MKGPEASTFLLGVYVLFVVALRSLAYHYSVRRAEEERVRRAEEERARRAEDERKRRAAQEWEWRVGIPYDPDAPER